MSYPYGQTIIVSRGVRDPFGDTTWGATREIRGVAVSPQVSSESSGDLRTMRTTTGLTLYLPPGHGVTAADRVTLADGTTWQVQGRPAGWRNPFTGWAPGDQVDLEMVEG